MRVYSAMEDVRSADMMRARAEADEAQRAIVSQKKSAHRAWREGVSALSAGDRAGQTASEALHGAACVMQGRLEPVHRMRQEQSALAKEQYLASRMNREQIERLVERTEEKVATEEGRKMQAASDDRFLARRWMDESAQMKKP